MKITTEIYRGSDGNIWKITREGEDVMIEQAIEPADLPTYEPYDDQRYVAPPAEAYREYNSKGKLTELSNDTKHTISRKV